MLIIFGGILEVTHELNDMHAYDLSTGEWFIFYDEFGVGASLSSPTKQGIILNQASPETSPNRFGLTAPGTIKNSSAMKTIGGGPKDMGNRAYS